MAETARQADWETARAMVQCIVDRWHPRLVIVFGSLARGEAGPDSDIDLSGLDYEEGR